MSAFDFYELLYGVAVYENQKPESAGYYWAYAEGLTSEPWMVYYNPQIGYEVWVFGGKSRPVSDFTHYSNMIEMPRGSAVKNVDKLTEVVL